MSVSERSLDAPKRSRKSEHRSDGDRQSVLSRKFDRLQGTFQAHFRTRVFPETPAALHAQFSRARTRAPARHRHRHVGCERPRRSASGPRRAMRRRGRSRPIPVPTSVLGRSAGGTERRPIRTTPNLQPLSVHALAARTLEGRSLHGCASNADPSALKRGQPRLEAASPSSAPPLLRPARPTRPSMSRGRRRSLAGRMEKERRFPDYEHCRIIHERSKRRVLRSSSWIQ